MKNNLAVNTARLAMEDFRKFPCEKNFNTMIAMIVRASGISRPKAIEAVHAKIPASRNFGGM
jgi:hypothetical protein